MSKLPNRKSSNRSHNPLLTQEGTPTPLYYGFYDEAIGRQDWKYIQGLKGTRILEYTQPNEAADKARAKLEDKGLILGFMAEASSQGMKRYIIPNSAHPINHDRGSSGSNSLRYDDKMRFHDLGILLGAAARFDDSSVHEIQTSIGQNVAEVEFTLQAERRLLLVPGFEHYLTPVEGNQEMLLERYVSRLHEEFGARFERHIDQFAEGFDS